MCARLKILAFVLLSLLQVAGLEGRGPAFKVERHLGSSRLQWEELRWLVLPANGSDRLEAAVTDFMQVVADRGLRLQRARAGEASLKQTLECRIDPQFAEIGDGFRLHRERSRVRVRAANEAGLIHALYSLAMDQLGARWYWKGELGYVLLDDWSQALPLRIWEDRPAFVQRTMSSMGGEFARRNRLTGKYAFNHNLARVFTKEAYREHPEAFALFKGRVRAPKESPKYDRQPDFTEPAAIRIAVEAARQHFDENPESRSFSLSTNDNTAFDESPATEAVVGPIEYFRRRPNYTDLVFSYMNQVAKEVFRDPEYLQTESGEDRYLTALAYYWTEQSPSFPLHPRVMPILTSDRAQWHDPAYREEDKALIERWADSGAERIGTWDYYFGGPYPYPRQFNQWIAESIPFLYRAGIDVFFTQMPSVWGLDGPKAWLAAQLLWDPEQNPEELLSEYYAAFFGPGGDDLRAFYEIAEARRNAREGPANWIKFYKDEAGIERFDAATLDEMSARLTAAAARVPEGSAFAKRIELVAEAFSYTEAYHAYHAARSALVRACLRIGASDAGAPEAAPQALIASREAWKRARQHFLSVQKRVLRNPMHEHLKKFRSVLQSEPEHLFLGALARLHPNAAEALDADSRELVEAVRDWSESRKEAREITKESRFEPQAWRNRNFLGPVVPEFQSWALNFRPSEGLSFGHDKRLRRGLFIENADVAILQQHVDVEPEQIYVLDLNAAWQVSPDNRSFVFLSWYDVERNALSQSIVLRMPTGPEMVEGSFQLPVRAPEGADRLRIRFRVDRQAPGDWLRLNRLSLYAPENAASEKKQR